MKFATCWILILLTLPVCAQEVVGEPEVAGEPGVSGEPEVSGERDVSEFDAGPANALTALAEALSHIPAEHPNLAVIHEPREALRGLVRSDRLQTLLNLLLTESGTSRSLLSPGYLMLAEARDAVDRFQLYWPKVIAVSSSSAGLSYVCSLYRMTMDFVMVTAELEFEASEARRLLQSLSRSVHELAQHPIQAVATFEHEAVSTAVLELARAQMVPLLAPWGTVTSEKGRFAVTMTMQDEQREYLETAMFNLELDVAGEEACDAFFEKLAGETATLELRAVGKCLLITFGVANTAAHWTLKQWTQTASVERSGGESVESVPLFQCVWDAAELKRSARVVRSYWEEWSQERIGQWAQENDTEDVIGSMVRNLTLMEQLPTTGAATLDWEDPLRFVARMDPTERGRQPSAGPIEGLEQLARQLPRQSPYLWASSETSCVEALQQLLTRFEERLQNRYAAAAMKGDEGALERNQSVIDYWYGRWDGIRRLILDQSTEGFDRGVAFVGGGFLPLTMSMPEDAGRLEWVGAPFPEFAVVTRATNPTPTLRFVRELTGSVAKALLPESPSTAAGLELGDIDIDVETYIFENFATDFVRSEPTDAGAGALQLHLFFNGGYCIVSNSGRLSRLILATQNGENPPFVLISRDGEDLREWMTSPAEWIAGGMKKFGAFLRQLDADSDMARYLAAWAEMVEHIDECSFAIWENARERRMEFVLGIADVVELPAQESETDLEARAFLERAVALNGEGKFQAALNELDSATASTAAESAVADSVDYERAIAHAGLLDLKSSYVHLLDRDGPQPLRDWSYDFGSGSAELRGIINSVSGYPDEAVLEFMKRLATKDSTYGRIYATLASGETALLRSSQPEEKWQADVWPGAACQFILGEISAEAVLAAAQDAARDDPGAQLCEAHFFVGRWLERLGQREAARQHYQASLESKQHRDWESLWARMCLARLDGNITPNAPFIYRPTAVGFKDLSGKTVIAPRFWLVKPFQGGLTKIDLHGAEAIIDTQGRYVIPPIFSSIASASEGLVRVKSARYGYWDEAGLERIPERFTQASDFHEGRASVSTGLEKNDRRFGYIDTKGDWVIPERFVVAGDYHGGLASVRKRSEGPYQLIDRDGNTQPRIRSFAPLKLSEGLIRVQESPDGLLGYCDLEGNSVLPCRFSKADHFSGGFAAVQDPSTTDDKRWYFIDRRGKRLGAESFDDVSPFSEGVAAVRVSGKVGYYGSDGTFLVEPSFKWLTPYEDGVVRVQREKQTGFLDREGKLIGERWFRDGEDFHRGRAAVETETGWGLIDRTGAFFIAPTLAAAPKFGDGLYSFEEGLLPQELAPLRPSDFPEKFRARVNSVRAREKLYFLREELPRLLAQKRMTVPRQHFEDPDKNHLGKIETLRGMIKCLEAGDTDTLFDRYASKYHRAGCAVRSGTDDLSRWPGLIREAEDESTFMAALDDYLTQRARWTPLRRAALYRAEVIAEFSAHCAESYPRMNALFKQRYGVAPSYRSLSKSDVAMLRATILALETNTATVKYGGRRCYVTGGPTKVMLEFESGRWKWNSEF